MTLRAWKQTLLVGLALLSIAACSNPAATSVAASTTTASSATTTYEATPTSDATATDPGLTTPQSTTSTIAQSAISTGTISTGTISSSTVPVNIDPGRGHSVETVFVDRGMQPLTVRSQTSAVRSWYVISTPTDSEGPFPLVIVLHGAHSFCTPPARARSWPCPPGLEVPNHHGFSTLTESLAANGFVAIALGINAEYATPGQRAGEVAAALIVRDALAAATAGSLIDRNRVAIVGHSRGGAIAAVLQEQLPTPISAAVLIAPTSDTVDPSRLADVPMAVIVGTCDGDTGVDGGAFVTEAMVQTRQQPIGLALITGAGHNAINDRLEPEPPSPGQPGCATDMRLSPSDQRAQAATLVPELLRVLMDLPAEEPATQFLRTDRQSDVVQPGVRFVHVDPKRRTIAVSPAPGVAATNCPGGQASLIETADTSVCNRIQLAELVGRPASQRVSWATQAGAVELFRFDALNAASRDTLVIRGFADPLRNPPGTTMSFRIEAVDPTSTDPTNSASSFKPWGVGFDVLVPPVGDPLAADVRRGAVLWTEQRFTLPSDVSAASLLVTQPGSGTFDLVGVDVISGG
jgi:pimeloyl-ACP methyl ester carboxylesterase